MPIFIICHMGVQVAFDSVTGLNRLPPGAVGSRDLPRPQWRLYTRHVESVEEITESLPFSQLATVKREADRTDLCRAGNGLAWTGTRRISMF
jgi:hypothetical protein